MSNVVSRRIDAAIACVSSISQRDRISNVSQSIRKNRLRGGSSRDQVGAPLPAAGPAYNVSSSRRAGRVDIYVPNMARAAPNGRRNFFFFFVSVSPSSLAVFLCFLCCLFVVVWL